MKGGLVTPSKSLPSHSSFESIRKRAKKLARQIGAGEPDALARVHSQLLNPTPPLSLRDAQLVLAREYGFAGWQALRAAALRLEGKGLEWAVAEAERAIHDNNLDRLRELVRRYPALLSWRGDSRESLLGFATGSFGDSGDPYREKMFTRIECAEFLLDAGATVEPAIWEGAINVRAKGALQLLLRKFCRARWMFSRRSRESPPPSGSLRETVSGTAVSSNCVLGWMVYAGPDSDQETAPPTATTTG